MVHDYRDVRNNTRQRRFPVTIIDRTALVVRAFSP
jgi:hypothetical protein